MSIEVEYLSHHEQFTIARRRAGLRQVDVARELGIGQPRLSLYERGRMGLPLEVRRRAWAIVERALESVA
jgi:transcriptional regulator with XRE-family HTH domain